MSKGVIVFNVIYYFITIVLIMQGRKDQSVSLGYGILLIGFWIVAIVILFFLLAKKIMYPRSILDKIGVFTATPLIPIGFIVFFLSFKENVSSVRYFNKGNYRYKVKEINYGNSSGGGAKRIEIYRSADTVNSRGHSQNDLWLKDSIWIYLSKGGDTIKKVTYKDNVEIE